MEERDLKLFTRIPTLTTERPETYEDEEIIMRDDVTERERLEEVKRRNGII